jgi:hypothetical protein
MTEYRIVERTWINSKKYFFIEYKGWFNIWHRLGISMNYDTKKQAEVALSAWMTPDVIHKANV